MQDLKPQLTISEIPAFVKETYNIDPSINLYFEGPPGIGKTDGVLQGASLLQKEYPDFGVAILILSQMESSDFTIPWVFPLENGKVTYRKLCLEDFILSEGTRKIIFADELPNSSWDVQKAFQNVLSSRKIGDTKIPDGVLLIGAGNRKEDRAGANGMLSSVANRMCFIDCVVDETGETWNKWALHNGIDFRVRYYVNEHPGSLFDFDSKREINATPRQWAKVSKVIKGGGKFLYTHIAGLVGQQKATHLKATIDLFDELPRKDEIIASPMTCKLPKKQDWMVPISFAMIDWMDEKNRDALCTYLMRMGLEHQSMVFKSLKETKVNMLMGNKQFLEWNRLNQDLLVGA